MDGEVFLEALADGEYWLGVAGQPRIEYYQEEIELGVERPLRTVEVTVNPRVLTSGVVLDGDGRPVEGARVRAAKYRSKTWTGKDGTFEVYADRHSAIVCYRAGPRVQAEDRTHRGS